jgi:hypothetical protein
LLFRISVSSRTVGFAMRWVRSLSAVGCAITVTTIGFGCLATEQSRVVVERPGILAEHASPDLQTDAGRVLLHTRLIEQPLGDEYLSHTLWTQTANPLPHGSSAVLGANGIRVGLISGVIPADLERLATSEAAIVDASLRIVLSDLPKPVPIKSSGEMVNLEVVRTSGDAPESIEISNAEFALIVTATPTTDGQVKVRCEPRIQHGEKQPHWGPTADGTSFERNDLRPTEQFPTLAWEVTLARHEVLLVGSTEEEAPGNLGATFFRLRDTLRQRQRVLAIQADYSSGKSVLTSGVSGLLAR